MHGTVPFGHRCRSNKSSAVKASGLTCAALGYRPEAAAFDFPVDLLAAVILGITISSTSPLSLAVDREGSTSTGNSSTEKIRCALFSM